MKYLYLIALTLLYMAPGCKHQAIQPVANNTPNDTSGNDDHPCSPDTVYFVNDVLPLILSNCTMSGCHNTMDHADGVTLMDYNSIMNDGDVTPFKPAKSDLYEVLVDGDPDKQMPYKLPSLPASDINKVKKWIEQGALNNACTDCDSSMPMSYVNHIAPIMQSNCNGCHNPGNLSAGVDLSTYSTIIISVNNGKLNGVINHLGGFKPMPQNAPKLSNCSIAKIVKWINYGALDN